MSQLWKHFHQKTCTGRCFDDLDPCLVYQSIPVSGNYEQIGQGSYARVYKATVEGNDLAVKIFADTNDDDGKSQNAMLRQEVDILKRLQHPCVISLVGVCLRPRMLLLEYAAIGNLETVLSSNTHMSRRMQYRIVVQMAEGMYDYLEIFHIFYVRSRF